ncbi:hypothetical protein BP6252_12078 [Coleophoma cylindrospora]|uniref:Pyruvate decarboxylase n=1 Tax=Coleophoma cylindrospora TaxID=1849047 RepID=A0A3D8QFW6_9HELO|nr:hypothetical protein BP6252_12078 [Coleophoma cylindrospora]
MSHLSLARYLFTRIKQCGVNHVHGVPGDFSLKALDHIPPSGMKWVGGCNELNAGYAADGYARIRGLAALCTTYGVGELSAINAIAGAYAEHVPVIHVVGTPARHLQESRACIHHSLGDGRLRVYADMYKQVTTAQANLINARNAPELIDDVIQECVTRSRPVYIELPADMVDTQVSSDRLQNALKLSAETDGKEEAIQVKDILSQLYLAKRPLILVDRGDGVEHIIDEINQFVCVSGIPTLTMPSGAGMIDASFKNYFGPHSGPIGKVNSLPYAQASDFVLAFGPMFADTQTLGWSTVPDSKVTTRIGRNSIDTFDKSTSIDSKTFMQKLIDELDVSRLEYPSNVGLESWRIPDELPSYDPSTPINQTNLWPRLNSYLQPDDIMLLAASTALLAARDFALPPRVKVIASGMWFSVGQMLPAAQGAALAQQQSTGGRTVLLEGDGSFQMTAQELSTIIKLKLNVTVFLINNGGYAYERHIHGMDADYNDIAPWRYLEAASFFGADGDQVGNYRVTTIGDLDALLANPTFQTKSGLKIVEIIVGKYDIPEKLKEVFQKAGAQTS